MNMEVTVANPTGFCFGVRRAIDALENVLDSASGKVVVSIGMPIHNPQEVDRLRSRGLLVVDSVKDVPDGARVVIRAHGEPRCVYDELSERGIEITDATCTFVKRAQEEAYSLSKDGYSVILLGNKDHPEVRSIVGHADAHITVVASPEEAKSLPCMSKIGLISQTTQQEEKLAQLAGLLVPKAGKLLVSNTICRATVERQEAVRKLAKNVDGVIIVGGRSSANTEKLYEIAKSGGENGEPVPALLVESADELDRGWLQGKDSIGVAAGASTPKWLIETIYKAVAKMKVG